MISNSSAGLNPNALGEQVGREHLLRGVELRRDVVVELPREADLVLRRRQLLLQHLHVLVRLERAGSSRPPRAAGRAPASAGLPSAAASAGPVAVSAFARASITAVSVSRSKSIDAADGVDQIRDEIVPPLELHVDLPPAVQHLIPQADQPVVAADRPQTTSTTTMTSSTSVQDHAASRTSYRRK